MRMSRQFLSKACSAVVPNTGIAIAQKLITALGVLAVAIAVFNLKGSVITKNVILTYEAVINFLLGWATPYVQMIASVIGRLVNVELNVAPHWKYVFVLLMIFFSRDAYGAWVDKTPVSAIYHGVLGFGVALLASIATSLGSTGLLGGALLATVPVIGLYLYAFFGIAYNTIFTRHTFQGTGHASQAIWPHFRRWQRLALVRLAVGLSFIPIFDLATNWQDDQLVTAVLFASLILNAVFWIIIGIQQAHTFKEDFQEQYAEYFENGYSRTGFGVISVLVAAFFLLLALEGSSILIELIGVERTPVYP